MKLKLGILFQIDDNKNILGSYSRYVYFSEYEKIAYVINYYTMSRMISSGLPKFYMKLIPKKLIKFAGTVEIVAWQDFIDLGGSLHNVKDGDYDYRLGNNYRLPIKSFPEFNEIDIQKLIPGDLTYYDDVKFTIPPLSDHEKINGRCIL